MSIHKIKVTAEDIKNGVKNSPDKCPVALAITRQLNIDEVDVMGYHWDFIILDTEWYLVPDEVSEFMTAFNDGETVKPFEFVLYDVEELDEFYEDDLLGDGQVLEDEEDDN